MAARWELHTLQATSLVWTPQEHSQHECHHTQRRSLQKVSLTLHSDMGPLWQWLTEVNGKSVLPGVSAGLRPAWERKKQLPVSYEVLCGLGSKATLHSLDFSFKRRCIKEKNSTNIFLGHRKLKKYIHFETDPWQPA